MLGVVDEVGVDTVVDVIVVVIVAMYKREVYVHIIIATTYYYQR